MKMRLIMNSREIKNEGYSQTPVTDALWQGVICPTMYCINDGNGNLNDMDNDCNFSCCYKLCQEYSYLFCLPCAQFAINAIPVTIGAACSVPTLLMDGCYNVAKTCGSACATQPEEQSMDREENASQATVSPGAQSKSKLFSPQTAIQASLENNKLDYVARNER